MQRKLIWVVVAAFAVFLSLVLRNYQRDPEYSLFVVRWVLSIGTFCAVLFALYGDYLREKIDPIRVRIEVPEESNTVFDKCEIDGTPHDVYCHHLRVRNLTPHRPIKDCRVWLQQVFTQNVGGDWREETKFAVPRLMRWAPFEYSEDKRTFGSQQVFDFGKTISNDKGFEVTVNPVQGGTFNRRFPVGRRLRFVFVVTADNYHQEKTFCFEVSVPQSVQGTPVTPSMVTVVKKA